MWQDLKRSLDSSVGVAARLRAEEPMYPIRFPTVARECFTACRPDLGPPIPHLLGVDFFLGGKVARAEVGTRHYILPR
jgi:hypothetical protein